jgi:hypothetical protein
MFVLAATGLDSAPRGNAARMGGKYRGLFSATAVAGTLAAGVLPGGADATVHHGARSHCVAHARVAKTCKPPARVRVGFSVAELLFGLR